MGVCSVDYAIVGVSHHSATIELRERLAVPQHAVAQALRAAQARFGGEWMLLSTCNRVEWLMHGVPGDVAAVVAELMAELCAVPESEFRQALRVFAGAEAVRHSFRVASGLDSMVLGEPQVLGQWKAAFQTAVDAGTAGTYLTRLGQRALQTAKRVRSETEIGRYATSLSSLAVTLAQEIFEPLAHKRVLVLGAGEMAELAVMHLRERGVRDLVIANRTRGRAERVAADHSARAVDWADWPAELALADIILVGAGAEGHLITQDQIRLALKGAAAQPRLIVDLAVPRAVDPAVAALRDVFLYCIDDLEVLSRANRERRQAEAERAEAMVDEAVARFGAWYDEQQWAPTLAELTRWLDSVRAAEVERALAAAGDNARSAAENAAAAVARRVIQTLAQQLKRGDPDDAAALARALAATLPAGGARDATHGDLKEPKDNDEHAAANRFA